MMTMPYTEFWWRFVLLSVFGYLLGSINFSVLFSRLIKKQDIREKGSHNPGTTNMFRVFGLSMGLLTFVCDALKGVVPCLVALLTFSNDPDASLYAVYFVGFFTVLGHIFPVWHRFRGGKGVATTIGVLFVAQPLFNLCAIWIILVVVLITDRMSVSALLYMLFCVVWHWANYASYGLLTCLAVTGIVALVYFAHRHNIVRLVKGKELPMGLRKKIFRINTPEAEKVEENFEKAVPSEDNEK